MRWTLPLLLVLQACGGGSESTSPGGDFSYSPSSLSFSAQVDAAAPAAQIVELTALTSTTQIPGLIFTADVLDDVRLDVVSSDTIHLTVSVLAPALLGVGSHNSSFRIEGEFGDVTIPVAYTVTPIPPGDPEVHFIGPGIVSPGVATPAILRGSGFSRFAAGNLPTISIGAQDATGITVINDSTMELTTPALTVGSHAVEMSGGGTLFASSLELQVVGDQVYSSTDIATAGEKSRLIYDRARRALYVVNTTTDSLERYRYQGGTTWNVDTLSLSGLADATLSPVGAALVLVDGASFYEVDPAAATLTAGPAVNAPLGFNDSVDVLARGNGAAVLAVGNNQWTPLFTYDLLSGETDTLTFINPSQIEVEYSAYNPWLFEVPDGGRIYLGEHGSTGSRLYVLDTSDHSMQETGLVTGLGGFYDYAQTPDGGRVLLNTQDIYSADFATLLGSLPLPATRGALSPDGNIAYLFTDFNGVDSNLLRAFDISDPAAPAQIGSDLVLANGPGMRAKMQLSPDGNTLFIVGLDALHVIDLTTLVF